MLGQRSELTTNDGSVPVAILGEGRVYSEQPAFDDIVGRDHLVYATLNDSLTYGNPAFWFALTEDVTPCIAEGQGDLELDVADVILRRVAFNGTKARFDMRVLGR